MHRFTAFALLLLSCITSLVAQIPTDPLLHLRADSGVVVVAGTIAQWKDMSGNGNDAVQN